VVTRERHENDHSAAEKAQAIAAAERAAATYTEAKRDAADEDTLERLRLRCIEAGNAIGALTR
jgi:hypothetical protein